MALIFQKDTAGLGVEDAARQLMNAAMTAPKACAANNLVIAFADREETKKIAAKMIALTAEGRCQSWVERDGRDTWLSEGVLLIGTKLKPLGVSPCGSCGFENCGEKAAHAQNPCAFNCIDLGIALGSVVSKAADMRIDNRIMFSIGIAVKELGWLGEDVPIIIGIPLDVKNKSHFYDRTETMASHFFKYPEP